MTEDGTRTLRAEPFCRIAARRFVILTRHGLFFPWGRNA